MSFIAFPCYLFQLLVFTEEHSRSHQFLPVAANAKFSTPARSAAGNG